MVLSFHHKTIITIPHYSSQTYVAFNICRLNVFYASHFPQRCDISFLTIKNTHKKIKDETYFSAKCNKTITRRRSSKKKLHKKTQKKLNSRSKIK